MAQAIEKQSIIPPEFGRVAVHLRFPRYLVTETGAVFSLVSGEPKQLRPIRRGDYPGFTLSDKDRKLRPVTLHRLVAETFHGRGPTGHEVRHLDGNAENGSASNLSWGTRSQNMHDKHRHGTATIGERHPGAKLTAMQVRMIRKFEQIGVPRPLVRKHYGISPMNHARIISRELWRHVQ